ncbi:unnamed protein product [Alopecurus aequalis]
MAREVEVDNDIDINMKDREVFPNGEAKNNAGNGKAVRSLQQSLDEVQGILEHNRMLLQEIGQDHETHEVSGLNRTFALMCELDNNMARVVNLYSDLSSYFSGSVPEGSPVVVDGTKGGYKEAATSE